MPLFNYYVHYTANGYLKHGKDKILRGVPSTYQKGYNNLNQDFGQTLLETRKHLRKLVETKTSMPVEAIELAELLTLFKYNNTDLVSKNTIDKIRALAGEKAVENFQEYFSSNYLPEVARFDQTKKADDYTINLLGHAGYSKASIMDKNENNYYQSRLQDFRSKIELLQKNYLSIGNKIAQSQIDQLNDLLKQVNTEIESMKDAEGAQVLEKYNNDIKVPLSTSKKNQITNWVKIYNNLIFGNNFIASSSFQGEAFEDMVGILGGWFKQLKENPGKTLGLDFSDRKLSASSKERLGIVGKQDVKGASLQLENFIRPKTWEELKKIASAKLSGNNKRGAKRTYSIDFGDSQGTIDVNFEWPLSNLDAPLKLSLKNYKTCIDTELSLVKDTNLLALLNLTTESFIAHFANITSQHRLKPNRNSSIEELPNNYGTNAALIVKQAAALRGLIGIRDSIMTFGESNKNYADYFVVDYQAKRRVYVFPTQYLANTILNNEAKGVTIHGLINHNKIRIFFENEWEAAGKKAKDRFTSYTAAWKRNSRWLIAAMNQKITAGIVITKMLPNLN